jgi:hypothetical protein
MNARAAAIAIAWLAPAARAAAGPAGYAVPDDRLPSPYLAYHMEGPTVALGFADFVNLYDLWFQASEASDVAFPTPTSTGLAFDSTFDVTFGLDMSIGSGPVFHAAGAGVARAVGEAVGDGPTYVFQSELVALELSVDAFRPGGILYRESPTLVSQGETVLQALPGGGFGVGGYFDLCIEVSLDEGAHWLAADRPVYVVQRPSADFDADGDVDDKDLAQWIGGAFAGNKADADTDGDSDGADLLAWQRQTGVEPASLAPTAIPEPAAATIAVALIAAAALRAGRRRASSACHWPAAGLG